MTTQMTARLERVRTVDGVDIAYTTIGTGPAAVIALHGWGGAGSGHSWRELVKYLDLSGLRFIAIDLRGHGASDRPETGFDVEGFGRDVLAVADHAGAERFILAAYSMSGRWSQWLACRFPDRVLGQILIAPAPASALPLSEDLLEGWMRSTRTRASFGPWVNQFTSEPLSDDIVDAYFNDMSAASDHAKRETFRMLCRDDFSASVTTTTAGTLVLAGAHDPILSPEFLRQEIVSRIPGATAATKFRWSGRRRLPRRWRRSWPA